jgi:hypothetical protein
MRMFQVLQALEGVFFNRIQYKEGVFGSRVPSMGTIAVYINGYGAPIDILKDKGYYEYLSRAFDAIDTWGDRVRMIYLCGGCTNSDEVSEAEAMKAWVARFAPQWVGRVRLIEDTMTVRENIRAFAKNSEGARFPVFFCEYSREWTVAALAAVFLPGDKFITTAGVRFSKKDLTVGAQLKQMFVNLPLELASLRFSPAERVRARRREHVVDKARKERQAASVGKG